MVSGFSDGKVFVMLSCGISCFFSIWVIATGLIFPSLRKKLFMRIIVVMAICDLFACGSILLGFPESSSSILCILQAASFNFFFRATWTWTVCMSYQLYGLILNAKLPMTERQMHVVCWSLVIVFQVLPFAMGDRYGNTHEGHSICILQGPYLLLAVVLVFSGYALVCIIILIVLAFRVHYYIEENRSKIDKGIITISNILRLYPLSMMICWIPNIAVSIIFDSSAYINKHAYYLMNISLGIGMLFGSCVAGIFFYNSREAYLRWRYFFRTGDRINLPTENVSTDTSIAMELSTDYPSFRVSDLLTQDEVFNLSLHGTSNVL